jgi:hypothetical protein
MSYSCHNGPQESNRNFHAILCPLSPHLFTSLLRVPILDGFWATGLYITSVIFELDSPPQQSHTHDPA